MGETIEKWVPVRGWGNYSVSNLGRIRGESTYRRYKKGRILTPVLCKEGRYARIMLHDKSKKRLFFIHRIVIGSFIGPPPEGHVVNHRDFNGLNNSLENLEYVTQKENIAHSWRAGRCGKKWNIGIWTRANPKKVKGSGNFKAKLTDSDVKEIRSLGWDGLRVKGLSLSEIGNRYGVSDTTIHAVLSGKTWTHI